MRGRVAGVALLAALLAAGGAGAADERLTVRIDPEDPRVLLRWESESKTWRSFPVPFRSELDRISDAVVSPVNRHVAVIETTDGDADEGFYRVPPRNRLTILAANGRVSSTREENVQRVVFSPDGSRLAFLVGHFLAGGIGFEPEAARILELGSGRVSDIPQVGRPYDLRWIGAAGGDRIYLRDLDREEGVYRYEPARGRVEFEAGSDGFDYSPDGSHYLVGEYEAVESGRCEPGAGESCFRVVEASTGRPVTGEGLDPLGAVGGWVYGEGSLLLFTRQTWEESARGAADVTEGSPARRLAESKNAVVDLRSNRVVQEFDGVVSRDAVDGTAGDRHLFVMSVEGDVLETRVLARPSVPATPTPTAPPPPRPRPRPLPAVLDFNHGPDGGPVPDGLTIDDEFAGFGIRVYVDDPARHPARIFDTSRPSSRDQDLGSPNEACPAPGPGIGAEGAPGRPGVNCRPLGNVLVIADHPSSGKVGDYLFGGRMRFVFDVPLDVEAVTVLDIDSEAEAGWVRATMRSGGTVGPVAMQPVGDNSVQRIALPGARQVTELEVFFPGSGALAEIEFGLPDLAEAERLLSQWAAAWSAQRVDDYLAFYSEEQYRPPGASADAWRRERRQRIENPQFIRVAVEVQEVEPLGPRAARVRFLQRYESDRVRDSVTKVVDLVREEGGWKIAEEKTVEER